MAIGAGLFSFQKYKESLSSFKPVHAESELQKGICVLKGEPGNESISGVVQFNQISDDKVVIEAQLSGLKPGAHGFHIHSFGNLTKGCETAGGHYNPFNKNHGSPKDKERHVGDLGNLEAKKDGTAYLKIEDTLVKLNGPTSVIGRALVLHANPDDLGKGGQSDSLTTGHAGPRIACGVIGRANN